MKVRELQLTLSNLDPELNVLCYTEDEELAAYGTISRLLEIERVEATRGERMRLDDGTPHLKLGEGPASVTLAIVRVTAEF